MYGSMGGIGIANLAGSFIAFLATPVLSRLYSPEQLGLYFYTVTLASLVSICISGQLFYGIQTSRNIRLSRRIYAESIYVVVAGALVLLASLTIGAIASRPFPLLQFDLAPLIWAVLYGSLLAWVQIRALMLIRLKEWRKYTGSTLARPIAIAAVQLSLPLVAGHTSPGGLLIGASVGELASLAIGGFFNTRELSPWAGKRIWVRFYSWRYSGLLRFFLPSQLMNIGANALPSIVLKSTGEAFLLGAFGLLLRIFQVPLSALSDGIRGVYWISIQNMRKRQLHLTLANALAALFLTAVVALGYLASGLNLVAAFAGPSWQGIDAYVPFIVFWCGTSLAVAFPVEILKHTGRLRRLFWSDALASLLKTLAVFIAAWSPSVDIVIAFCSVAGCCNLFNLTNHMRAIHATSKSQHLAFAHPVDQWSQP